MHQIASVTLCIHINMISSPPNGMISNMVIIDAWPMFFFFGCRRVFGSYEHHLEVFIYDYFQVYRDVRRLLVFTPRQLTKDPVEICIRYLTFITGPILM